MTADILVSRPSEGVGLIVIDSPPANALGARLRDRLAEAFQTMNDDLTVRVIVLTGAGSSFCAGDDLREAMTRGDTAMDSLLGFADLLAGIEAGRAPVIAAVNGAAVGGGFELALACDIRLASTVGHFTAAGVNVGLMASTYRLPRIVGVGRAKSILLTGQRVSAESALTAGLVTGVYSAEALLDEALALATRIASRAPLSVEATKRQSTASLDQGPQDALAAAVEELTLLAASDDHRAAVKALFARETALFTRS